MEASDSLIKERLIEELKNTNLSTYEIVKRVGVSPEMITQYTTTKKLPKLVAFAKLCKELDLSSNYVLGLTDYQKKISGAFAQNRASLTAEIGGRK